MDAGNWELRLKSGVNTIRLIDDSSDKFDQLVSAGGRTYNIVSGTLNIGASATINTAASTNPLGGYGLFYPDRGILVLNPGPVTASLGLAYNATSSATDLANNHGLLFDAFNNAGYFSARNEEIVTSTHYFVRAKNRDYNFSNNPTYYTSSDGTLKVPSFIGDPHTYITTIGLYNDFNELLAVSKLSKPILKSFDREALVKVKIDF